MTPKRMRTATTFADDADPDATGKSTGYGDDDGDGYGDPDQAGVSYCDAPEGFSLSDGDCDDGDAGINPGIDETPYDGVDQDCDGWGDNDADHDGYDDAGHGGDDCDDAAEGSNPGALKSAETRSTRIAMVNSAASAR